MPKPNKQKIQTGRQAVDAYRLAHTKLYDRGWHKGIPEEHTPLLDMMLKVFKQNGFNSLDEFFDAYLELKARELGYNSRADLWQNGTEESKRAIKDFEVTM